MVNLLDRFLWRGAALPPGANMGEDRRITLVPKIEEGFYSALVRHNQ
ncbi:hypothetical protein J2129_000797 [Methanofollis sp. W23]|nr:hypothetical protein [Methanofollis sp. W23]